jgi:hypothetical protein
MMSYPVKVPRMQYRGADSRRGQRAREHNRVASRIEDYLNADLSALPDGSVKVYLSYRIADQIGEDPELVQEIVFGIAAGHHGVTIAKGDPDRASGSKHADDA